MPEEKKLSVKERLISGVASLWKSAHEMTAQERLELAQAEARLTQETSAEAVAEESLPSAEMPNASEPAVAAYEAQIAALQQQIAASQSAEAEAQAAATDGLLLSLTRSGLVIPAAAGKAKEILALGGDAANAFQSFLELNGKHVAMADNAPNDAPTNGATVAQAVTQRGSSDNSALAEMAGAYAKEHGVTYAAALAKVATANRALVESSIANLPNA